MYIGVPDLSFLTNGVGFVVWAIALLLLPLFLKTTISTILGLLIVFIVGLYLYMHLGTVLTEPLFVGTSGFLTVIFGVCIWAIALLLVALFVHDVKALLICLIILIIVGVLLYMRIGSTMSLPLFGGSIPTGTPLPTPTPTPGGGMPTN